MKLITLDEVFNQWENFKKQDKFVLGNLITIGKLIFITQPEKLRDNFSSYCDLVKDNGYIII